MDDIKEYSSSINSMAPLTPEEEKSLAKRIKRGDRLARAKMIQSNLRLVINIAKYYSDLGVSIPDLIQEGNIGLIKAVDKFEYKRGYRFSTCAAWWIKKAIWQCLNKQTNSIKISEYMKRRIKKFKDIFEDFKQKNKRGPTLKEIARKMKISVKEVKKIQNIILGPGQSPISLQAPIDDDVNNTIGDTLGDKQLYQPYEEDSLTEKQEEQRKKIKSSLRLNQPCIYCNDYPGCHYFKKESNGDPDSTTCPYFKGNDIWEVMNRPENQRIVRKKGVRYNWIPSYIDFINAKNYDDLIKLWEPYICIEENEFKKHQDILREYFRRFFKDGNHPSTQDLKDINELRVATPYIGDLYKQLMEHLNSKNICRCIKCGKRIPSNKRKGSLYCSKKCGSATRVGALRERELKLCN